MFFQSQKAQIGISITVRISTTLFLLISKQQTHKNKTLKPWNLKSKHHTLKRWQHSNKRSCDGRNCVYEFFCSDFRVNSCNTHTHTHTHTYTQEILVMSCWGRGMCVCVCVCVSACFCFLGCLESLWLDCNVWHVLVLQLVKKPRRIENI